MSPWWGSMDSGLPVPLPGPEKETGDFVLAAQPEAQISISPLTMRPAPGHVGAQTPGPRPRAPPLPGHRDLGRRDASRCPALGPRGSAWGEGGEGRGPRVHLREGDRAEGTLGPGAGHPGGVVEPQTPGCVPRSAPPLAPSRSVLLVPTPTLLTLDLDDNTPA